MKVKDAARAIEERLPREWREEWDNVGLLIGDGGKEISRIGVALDAAETTVSHAVAAGCGLLVTHHPAIFRPLGSILTDSPVSRMIGAALRGDLAIYSAHTNWDSSPEGVNAVLARGLGLRDTSPITPSRAGAWGMGAFGVLPEPATLGELARRVKTAWGLSIAFFYGDKDAEISRVALCGGAGGELLPAVTNRGADVYITADLGYHWLQHAQLTGTNLIVVPHGEMERASLPALRRLVLEVTGLRDDDVEILNEDDRTPTVV